MSQQLLANVNFNAGPSQWAITSLPSPYEVAAASDLPPVDDTPPAEEDDPAGPRE